MRRRLISIARSLDFTGATDLSDRIEMMIRSSQVSGSDHNLSDPASIQNMEPTLRDKPVKPFIGDGFGDSDDEDRPEELKIYPKRKRERTKGLEIGVDVSLHHKSDPKKGLDSS